jgi:molybdopterin-guanine dinucleotide biosynthesis protein A
MEIEAFVLIGGKSSRLGQDKALLEFGGCTLAQRAVNTVKEALSPDQIYLVAAHESQFPTEDLPKNIPVIYDRYKDRGAYSALHAALSAAKSEWIFVLACDLPFVSADLLKFMAGLIDGVSDAVVNTMPGARVQPLCAFYRVDPFLKTIRDMIVKNEKLPPLRLIFEKINTRRVEFDEIGDLPGSQNFFFNLNSTDDLNNANNARELTSSDFYLSNACL